MMTKAEILERYKKKETIADSLGRLISVGRLRMSEIVKIRGFSGAGADEQTISMLMAVASVREIDGIAFAFPKDRAELDSTLDILDQEGFVAAAEATAKLLGAAPEAGAEDSKNAQATPPSGSSAS